MTLPPGLRKVVLTAHVTTSVGWLGAVVAYLGLDIAAATSQDVQAVRGAYLAMAMIIWYAVVPLALASVLIGIVNAVGTQWGLFRHYWVLVKLLLTLFATTILLLETDSVSYLAQAAASSDDPRELGSTLVHSGGGLLVLLTTTILSVFKPRGLTRYGWRKQQQQRRQQEERRAALVT
ncbi:MAG: DUF2269 domain-containing protein [Micromonosporaceae bacterium]|nr:DUF2269 domain-containing protein [Micromonosporaceae bacterium]